MDIKKISVGEIFSQERLEKITIMVLSTSFLYQLPPWRVDWHHLVAAPCVLGPNIHVTTTLLRRLYCTVCPRAYRVLSLMKSYCYP